MKLVKGVTLLSAAMMLAACGSSSSSDDEDPASVSTYSFESKVNAGESSVSHSGQSTRHLLINELKSFIASDELKAATTKEAALFELNRIYATGVNSAVEGTLYDVNVYGAGTSTDISNPLSEQQIEDGLTLVQTTFQDVSDDKNLKGKMAGCDNDLSQEEGFIGWTIPLDELIDCGQDEEVVLDDQDKAHTLIQIWFNQIADRVAAGEDNVYVTDEGLDLQQLIQKFLLGAVTYSQAAEDYLKATKGLLKQNTEADNQEEFDTGEDTSLKTYTSLEHQWDEGFGYFGAAHDYLAYTDAENKANSANDTNGDTQIDLMKGEYSFGHSINAAKRDVGSDGATDFSTEAMAAFIAGRKLINDNVAVETASDGADAAYYDALVAYSETALGAWEKAIASTVVHYINDVISETETLGTNEEAEFADRAKHWSEMKGFALSLQFRPIPTISRDDLITVHANMGEAPILTAEDAADYIVALEAARDLLKDAYQFDAEVVAGW